MDWIAVGTLIASLVAAVGAVWAVVISQKQLALARQDAELPLPTVEATLLGENSDLKGWTLIRLQLRNRAPIGVAITSVTMLMPADVEILTHSQVYGTPADMPWGSEVRSPLPESGRTMPIDVSLEREGAAKNADWGYFDIYAQCLPSRLRAEPDLRLSLEMRWRDHTTKTFEMAVNVVIPSTT